MKLLIFEPGQARISYGLAASLQIKGHIVYVIEFNNTIMDPKKEIMETEIGLDGNTEKVGIIKISIPLSDSKSFFISNSQLFNVVSSIKPDVLISSPRYWVTAKKLAKFLNKPLLFWYPVVPGIFKLPVFLSVGKKYSKVLTAPFGFIYNILLIIFSDYTFTNDVMTTKILTSLGIKNVKTIWPTYAKLLNENAYASYVYDTKKSDAVFYDRSRKYILSMILLIKNAPVYKIELEGLNFIKNIALKLPDIDFVVIGGSLEDTENPIEYKDIKNLKLIGRIYDDELLSKLYNDSLGVICPIQVPGFSNRLLEAFFYGKAIVSTSIVENYYEGLQPNKNILFADTVLSSVEAIKHIDSKSHFKRELEHNSRNYYINYFSPLNSAESVEQVILYYGRLYND